MSYYTEFVLECDKLTCDRLISYWKKTSWDDAELQRPDLVWMHEQSAQFDDTQYLMYFSINHAPYVNEIVDFLTDTIGVDYKRFLIRSKGECEDVWTREGGFAEDIDHIVESVYDDSVTETHRKAQDGYKVYEYCDIAVDPAYWVEISIDYTKDEMPESRTPELDILIEIREALSEISDSLARIANKLEEED